MGSAQIDWIAETLGKPSGRTKRGRLVSSPWDERLEVIKMRRLWFSSSPWINACLHWWFSNWGSLGPWSPVAWSQTHGWDEGEATGRSRPPTSHAARVALCQNPCHILQFCTRRLKTGSQCMRQMERPWFKFTCRVVTGRTTGLLGSWIRWSHHFYDVMLLKLWLWAAVCEFILMT